jgi:hypothetical protein
MLDIALEPEVVGGAAAHGDAGAGAIDIGDGLER